MGYYAIISDNSYLAHHGIKGQKWGVRRYQNADGSLTAAGYQHYYGNSSGMSSGERREFKAAMRSDRDAWKRSSKEAYKSAKDKVRTGQLSKDSEEYKNISRDRYMAKYGSKKGIDMYRHGTKDQKNEAIKEAGSRKAGRIATTAALSTVSAATIAGTAVAATAVANALAGIGLTSAAAAGTSVATIGTVAATSKGFGNNLKRFNDQNKNVVTSYDGSETYRGTGANKRLTVNMPKLNKDSRGNIIDKESQKDSYFKALDSEINRFIKDKWAQQDKTSSNVSQYEWIKGKHMERTDGLIDGLLEMGVPKNEIDNRISNQLNSSNYLDDSDRTIDYDYNKRHRSW